jgi:hypothetical protein
MKKLFLLFFIVMIISISPAYGHKLISHDDSHRDFDSALVIPDHKISWAIYENLGTNETKFYTFDAKKGDSFYASIVIPNLDGLEKYSPSLILMNEDMSNGNTPSNIQSSIQKFLYEGDYPGNEFEISSSGQAMLRLRILAENTGSEVISLKCTGPSICSYDVWDGSKSFKYAGMDFVSGQIPINPGTSVIFNMMFGPNIGYGGNQFEYDSSKNYNFRVNEDFGSIEIPLKIE